jgi:glutathione synthase/RimK-type ligase-like ATP-grasp enzyme
MSSAAILNGGAGAWAFEEHAQQLSRALGVEVSARAADYVYLLGWDEPEAPGGSQLFIPFEAIRLAADKRRIAAAFAAHGVPAPATHLVDSEGELEALLGRAREREWVLKWPTGCGAGGHRLLRSATDVPEWWPRPYVVQEFIRMDAPAVYRSYGVAGELFGWNVRRFPEGVRGSPWVAHAQGARYVSAGEAPDEAVRVARAALVATGLLDSFGCVDLLPGPAGSWLALEVGTDGVFHQVDRNIGISGLAEEIDRRIAAAFRARWPGRSSSTGLR